MADDDDFEVPEMADLLPLIDSLTTFDSASPPHPCRTSASPAVTRPRAARHGFRVTIRFHEAAADDDATSITSYREQLLQLFEIPECLGAAFDLTGVQFPPQGFVGLLASAKQQCREIELLNPSPAIQEILRLTKLDNYLLVRGSNT